jgi:predicted porin
MRSRPTNWLSLQAGYLYGDRQSDGYDYNVTSQSYWYTAAQSVNAIDNPQFLFGNHPDLRKYDVSDRERNQVDLSATITAITGLDVNLGYHYRVVDVDSDVAPVAPVLGQAAYLNAAQDPTVTTPGQQLGLLKEKRQYVSVDLHYTASARWSFNVFGNREEVDSTLRGMVYNENSRWWPDNPAIQVPTQLGPWSDPERLYTSKIEDETNTFGLGAGYDLIPGILRLSGDYTYSRGKVKTTYSGYGSDSDYLGTDWETFQFGYNSPETVRHNQYVLNASLEYQMFEGLTLGLHYIFDRYKMEDWMQEPSGAWVQEVGSEYFLRDSSEDNRWGNRLVNKAAYIYETHSAFATMTYRF